MRTSCSSGAASSCEPCPVRAQAGGRLAAGHGQWSRSARLWRLRAQAVNASAPRRPRPGTALAGVIEIDLPLGRVRLTGAVDLAAVRVVIEALSQR